MSTITRHARLDPADVFAALADPYTYPEWLVGCRTIRSVDDGWPQPGTHFHHRVGLVGPITIADNTESEQVDEPNRLVLQVRIRPFGRGRVTFRLTDEGTPGSPLTRIEMDEVPIGAVAPAQSLLDPLTAARSRMSLNALVAFLNAPEGTSKRGDSSTGEGAVDPASTNGPRTSVAEGSTDLDAVEDEARRQGELDRLSLSAQEKVGRRGQIREEADKQLDDAADRPTTHRE